MSTAHNFQEHFAATWKSECTIIPDVRMVAGYLIVNMNMSLHPTHPLCSMWLDQYQHNVLCSLVVKIASALYILPVQFKLNVVSAHPKAFVPFITIHFYQLATSSQMGYNWCWQYSKQIVHINKGLMIDKLAFFNITFQINISLSMPCSTECYSRLMLLCEFC